MATNFDKYIGGRAYTMDLNLVIIQWQWSAHSEDSHSKAYTSRRQAATTRLWTYVLIIELYRTTKLHHHKNAT